VWELSLVTVGGETMIRIASFPVQLTLTHAQKSLSEKSNFRLTPTPRLCCFFNSQFVTWIYPTSSGVPSLESIATANPSKVQFTSTQV
jgi:hypothetical protein